MSRVPVIAGAVLFLVAIVWVALGRGVRLEVHNGGDADLTDLVVRVGGVEIAIGDLDAGDSLSERLRTERTAKMVELTWKAEGRPSYARVDCYFEPSGYNGVIVLVIDGLVLRSSAADTEPGFY